MVKLITKTDQNCSDSVNENIVVGAIPVSGFNADKLQGCIPESIAFTDLSSITSGTIIKWEWDFGNTKVSNIKNPNTIGDF